MNAKVSGCVLNVMEVVNVSSVQIDQSVRSVVARKFAPNARGQGHVSSVKSRGFVLVVRERMKTVLVVEEAGYVSNAKEQGNVVNVMVTVIVPNVRLGSVQFVMIPKFVKNVMDQEAVSCAKEPEIVLSVMEMVFV